VNGTPGLVCARRNSFWRGWNNTGLHVTVGQRYQLVAVGTWWDTVIRSDADGYPTPWWYPPQRIAQRLRRLPSDDWFVLAGAIRTAEDCWHFAVGSSREVLMPTRGQLSFFANDVPGFYWNNFGSLRLEIARLS
jgi:hypothetical protein